MQESGVLDAQDSPLGEGVSGEVQVRKVQPLPNQQHMLSVG